MDTFGFQREALGSLCIGYSKGRVVTFKLTNQYDNDNLASIKNFSFKRMFKNGSGEIITAILLCISLHLILFYFHGYSVLIFIALMDSLCKTLKPLSINGLSVRKTLKALSIYGHPVNARTLHSI
jgi:hypothetical protein